MGVSCRCVSRVGVSRGTQPQLVFVCLVAGPFLCYENFTVTTNVTVKFFYISIYMYNNIYIFVYLIILIFI